MPRGALKLHLRQTQLLLCGIVKWHSGWPQKCGTLPYLPTSPYHCCHESKDLSKKLGKIVVELKN